jgi:hypothetical protein
MTPDERAELQALVQHATVLLTEAVQAITRLQSQVIQAANAIDLLSHRLQLGAEEETP